MSLTRANTLSSTHAPLARGSKWQWTLCILLGMTFMQPVVGTTAHVSTDTRMPMVYNMSQRAQVCADCKDCTCVDLTDSARLPYSHQCTYHNISSDTFLFHDEPYDLILNDFNISASVRQCAHVSGLSHVRLDSIYSFWEFCQCSWEGGPTIVSNNFTNGCNMCNNSIDRVPYDANDDWRYGIHGYVQPGIDKACGQCYSTHAIPHTTQFGISLFQNCLNIGSPRFIQTITLRRGETNVCGDTPMPRVGCRPIGAGASVQQQAHSCNHHSTFVKTSKVNRTWALFNSSGDFSKERRGPPGRPPPTSMGPVSLHECVPRIMECTQSNYTGRCMVEDFRYVATSLHSSLYHRFNYIHSFKACLNYYQESYRNCTWDDGEFCKWTRNIFLNSNGHPTPHAAYDDVDDSRVGVDAV